MRSVKVAASPDLMARVLADAEMVADRREAADVAGACEASEANRGLVGFSQELGVCQARSD